MAKDIRHYAKFTLDFPYNAKILPLSDAAFRCLVEATIWCCEHQTDGFLPSRLALARWSLQNLQELCATDPDKPTLLEHPDGWVIRDFAEHQATRAEIQERRERAKMAGQRGGLAKAKRTAKRTAKRVPSEMLSENVPTKAKAKAIGRGEGYVSNAREPHTNGSGAPAPPPCPKHPNGYDHDEPCQRCKALRIHAESQDARRTALNHERDEQIRQCGFCDNRGYIGLAAGPFIACPHNKQAINELEQQYTEAEANPF